MSRKALLDFLGVKIEGGKKTLCQQTFCQLIKSTAKVPKLSNNSVTPQCVTAYIFAHKTKGSF